MPKKKEPDCTQCHDHCIVNGHHACTNIPQSQGKAAYRFLKSLKPCEHFWRMNQERNR